MSNNAPGTAFLNNLTGSANTSEGTSNESDEKINIIKPKCQGSEVNGVTLN